MPAVGKAFPPPPGGSPSAPFPAPGKGALPPPPGGASQHAPFPAPGAKGGFPPAAPSSSASAIPAKNLSPPPSTMATGGLPPPPAGGGGMKQPMQQPMQQQQPRPAGPTGPAPAPAPFGKTAPSASPAPNRPPMGGPAGLPPPPGGKSFGFPPPGPGGFGKLPPPPGGVQQQRPPSLPPGPTSPSTPAALSASSPVVTGTPTGAAGSAGGTPVGSQPRYPPTTAVMGASGPGTKAAMPPPGPGGAFRPPPGPGGFQPSQQPQHQHQQPTQQQQQVTHQTTVHQHQQQPPLNAQNLQQHQHQQQQQSSAQQPPQQQQQQQRQQPAEQQQPQQQQNQQQYQAQGQTSQLGPNGRARMRNKPQGQNRIDSLQMPSPCRDLVVDGHPHYRWPPAPFCADSRAAAVPPTTASGAPCIDEGNAISKFLRPTMHQLPWDETALGKSNMPWGVALSPLCSKSVSAASGGGSRGLPVVHQAAIGTPNSEPVRCSRCRAYMSSWNPFNGTGHQWTCAFCGMANDVPESYFAPIAAGGKRRDHLERPELCRGSYEVDVTHMDKYWAEGKDTQKAVKPRPMHHLFVIDVSRQAAPTLKHIASAIREAVDAMPASGFGACSVSFVTYASTLHFYDFSDSRMPQLVVPDTTNPFVPLPFNLLCWMDAESQRERIGEFLDRLASDEFVEAVDETGCAIGAACKAGQLILADIGGKVIVTGSSAPTEGVGKIPERDVGRDYGNAQKEPALFKPHAGFWPDLAVECAKRHVSFDLYLFPTGTAIDLVTMGQLPHMTNGKQWLFYNFHSESDSLRLRRLVFHALNDEAGYGAILRTRCSSGVRVKAYHGHFTQTDPQDMDLAGVDSSSTFFVELGHDGRLEKKAAAVVQIALLYTTRAGRRRVRVHTLRLNVADTISTVFRYTDLEATLHAFICLSIHEAFNKGVKAAREFIVAKTVSLLVGYRVHSQSGSHSGQLLLPENLKLLPLYNLCLMKSDALASGTVVRFDDRVQNMFELMSYPQDRLLFYLYPRLFAMHALPEKAGEYKMIDDGAIQQQLQSHNAQFGGGDDEDGAGDEDEADSRPKVFLPPMLQLTADNVYQGGVYVLQDLQARCVLLLIGSQVAADKMMGLFGAERSSAVTQAGMDEWHPRVRRVVQQMMDETGRLVIVREKTEGAAALEDAFFRNLLEDEGPSKETCYSEFLCVLHKQINTKSRSA